MCDVVITIVFLTLLVDTMILTAVVPILPEYFYIKHEESIVSLSTTTTSPNVTLPTLRNISAVPTSSGEMHNVTAATPTKFEDQNSQNSSRNSTVGCKPSNETAFIRNENVMIGILLASKPLVQVVGNVVVGPLADRIGFDIFMFVGYIILFGSSMLFALGESYAVLLTARSIQGIGSAFASTAGLGLIADIYTGDEERGRAMGLVMGGFAFGFLIGPPFGSGVYALAGKSAVFYVLAGVVVITALLKLFAGGIQIHRPKQEKEATPLLTLLKDPYILLGAATLGVANASMALLESGLPIYMISTMCAKTWMLGVVFLPESLTYLISTYLFAMYGQRIPRWIMVAIGLLIIGGSSLWLAYSTEFLQLLAPIALMGIAITLVDNNVMVMMGNLVMTRHVPIYGSIYAISDLSFCAAFSLGPLLGGVTIGAIGFPWLMKITAILAFAFTPCIYFLRDPPAKNTEEETPILNGMEVADYSTGNP